MDSQPVLTRVDLGGVFPVAHEGKVRTSFDLPEGQRLQVATDRLSAFDVVFGQGIPNKGQRLTAVSEWWFRRLHREIPEINTHFITADWNGIVARHPKLMPFADQLAGRSTLVWRVDKPLLIEGIVRSVVYGSGWKEYQRTGKISGVELPPGLLQGSELAQPIFTPSTKAPPGEHDQNVSLETLIELGHLTRAQADEVQRLSLRIFAWGHATLGAFKDPLILADTKYEFGLLHGKVTLIDELHNSDSSRVWWGREHKPGGRQKCLDKECVREYLDDLCASGGWNKEPPAPELPEEVVEDCVRRYGIYHDLVMAA